MSSFYGGRPGNAFNIIMTFNSVQSMVTQFQKGPNYTTVHYDEYVSISSSDSNNGNVYRRGYDYTNNLGGAQLIGNLLQGNITINSAEVADARVGKENYLYSSLGEAIRASVQGMNIFLNATNWENYYDNNFNNLPNNIIIPCGVDTNEHAIENAPISGNMIGTIVTFGRSSNSTVLQDRKNGDTQLFIARDQNGILYRQYSTPATGGNSIWSDWSVVGKNSPSIKILAVGDSICSGFRNGGKGFIGDLGLPWVNRGIAGTTLSNIIDGEINGADRTCIPKQLARIPTTLPNYSPDIIIADGGIGDYFAGAELGAIPLSPVTTEEEFNALDDSTIMGGLQKLFYYMITLYPNAKRFFLITHKTSSQFPTSVFSYLPITYNSAGYTQQILHDAIVVCCKIYNVKIIDVYNDSIINSGFSQYKSPIPYSSNSNETDNEYIDFDGIHPLSKGYLEGYIPLIREAIQAFIK